LVSNSDDGLSAASYGLAIFEGMANGDDSKALVYRFLLNEKEKKEDGEH
jgi:hypothetical protein